MYFKLHRKPLSRGGDLVLLLLIFTCHPMKTSPISEYVICFLPSQTSVGYTLRTTDFVLLSLFPTLVSNILIDLGFLRTFCILRRCCKLHIACSSGPWVTTADSYLKSLYLTVFPLQFLVCLILSRLVIDFKRSASPSCYPTRGHTTPNKISLPNISRPLSLNAPQLQGIHLINSLALPPKQLS